MYGLSDSAPVEIKAGALELAAALNEALPLLQKPSEPLRQLVAEHAALKITKTEHEAILNKNVKVMNEHKISRTAFFEEQKKAKEIQDKKEREYAEKDKEILRIQNSIVARETATKKKEQEQKETAIALSLRHEQQEARNKSLEEREFALKTEKQRIESEKQEMQRTHAELRKLVG